MLERWLKKRKSVPGETGREAETEKEPDIRIITRWEGTAADQKAF